ncbi:MAG: response regulator transcription factor [Cyanobacteria bacterium J06555_13]
MTKAVLIVEDEIEIARLIQQLLEKEGFSCYCCADGAQAMADFKAHSPDLVILDWMLPGELDGLEICTRIRQQPSDKDPYILMLTAKGEELDRVIGLSTGADDYMVKPFSPMELVARVRALLRRRLREAGSTQVYQTRHFSIDIDQHTAQRQLPDQPAEPLDLATLEFKLLATFLSRPGRAWTRRQLIDSLWGDDFFGEDRVVDTQVARLRKKIEPNPTSPTFIKTVTGIGYKFEDAPAIQATSRA